MPRRNSCEQASSLKSPPIRGSFYASMAVFYRHSERLGMVWAVRTAVIWVHRQIVELSSATNCVLHWLAKYKGYLPRIRSIPENTNSILERGSLLTRLVKRPLSRETIWDTFATESFGSPVARAERLTFPGAKAHFKLLVRGTQTTVEMRLWFSASPCTTTTGRRKPGPEPVGSGSSAHHTSP